MWQVSGKSICVQLLFDVIDRMHPQVMRGFSMLKSRGAEIGGILLGRSEAGLPRKVSIEDFHEVRCEYLTGPSYNLSEKDLVAFEATIAHLNSGAERTGLSPVGFYRSHTRDELYMDDADLVLARRYFPNHWNVFLLIKPFPTRTSLGGFFFWEEGTIHHESSYLQFPLDRIKLGATRPATQRQPDLERPILPYTARSFHRPVWQWLLIPALLVVGGVAVIVTRRDVGISKASFGRPDPVSQSIRSVSSDPAHQLPEAVRSLPKPALRHPATAAAIKRTAKNARKRPVRMSVAPQEESEVELQRPAPRR